jgi:hypothetical protein
VISLGGGPTHDARAEALLAARLAPVIARAQRRRLLDWWTGIAAGGAALALALRALEERQGWTVGSGWALLLAATVAAALWARHRVRRRAVDARAAARLIEAQHPELRALLLTAVAQAPPAPGQPLGYMQEQLLRQALASAEAQPWAAAVSSRRLRAGTAGVALAAAALLYCAAAGLYPDLPTLFDDDFGLRVSPGDTQAERGTNVLVLARFHRRLPARATLVVRLPGKPPARVDMRRTLDDPVFGGMTPALPGERAEYFVEHDGGRSPRFRIDVFQAPDVQRLDARIEYPRLSLPAREVTDARFLSVLEGARVTVTARLQNGAREVKLQAVRDDRNAAEVIRLAAAGGSQRRVFTGVLEPRRSRRWDVLVTDEDGRRNDTPPRLTIDVHRNQPPQIALAFPGKDVRVSPLEEVTLEARIQDDVGVLGYGVSYRLEGRPARELRLGGAAGGGAGPAAAPAQVTARTVLALEALGAAPDQLLSYHFWAEDRDAQGKLRRSDGDMYFADVRPFEERFREVASDGQPGDQGGGGDEDQAVRKQKDIMNATWRLERDAREGRAGRELGQDAGVVKKSQADLATATEALRMRARDARLGATLDAAVAAMRQAAGQLEQVEQHPGDGPVARLASALEAEQRAYAGLLRARERQSNVTRGGPRGGGGGGQQDRPELSGLELKQKESRYETQREARSQRRGAAGEREALGRLEELARRQRALSERIKEMEAALARAATSDPPERERRLKRLREEQQELMEDIDQLARRLAEQGQQGQRQGQRGQQAQRGQEGQQGQASGQAQDGRATGEAAGGEAPTSAAQAARARTRQELERVRQEAAAAGEALARGETGRALGASTRVERQLERLRAEVARQVSEGFADEMRGLRDASQRLDDRQRALGEALAQAGPASDPTGTGPGPTETRRLAGEMRRQKQDADKLLEELRALSEAAEGQSPLLARKLYDGLREAKLADVDAALGAAGELLERNMADEARGAEARARRSIADLRANVEEAAKGVLGDEAQALRLAQAELDELLAQARREQAAPAPPGGGQRPGGQPQASGQQPGSQQPGGDQPGGGQPGGQQPGGSPPGGPSQPGSGPGGGAEGPITGGGFRGFMEQLRDVEDLLADPALRNRAAGVRDRARALRGEFRYGSKRPSAAVLDEQVLAPLVELRARVAEALARHERGDRLVPLDREPVPGRYADVVRRYWKSLAEGK